MTFPKLLKIGVDGALLIDSIEKLWEYIQWMKVDEEGLAKFADHIDIGVTPEISKVLKVLGARRGIEWPEPDYKATSAR